MKTVKFTDEEAKFMFDSLHDTWHKRDDELQKNPENFRIQYLIESKNMANEIMNKISKKTF